MILDYIRRLFTSVESDEQANSLKLTRELLKSIILRSGHTLIGNAPLDDDGIDFVVRTKDGSVLAILAVELSQAGDAQLSEHPVHGLQLSDRWIAACINKLPAVSPVRRALEDAIAKGKLTKAVGGVAKPSGNVVFTPVHVE